MNVDVKKLQKMGSRRLGQLGGDMKKLRKLGDMKLRELKDMRLGDVRLRDLNLLRRKKRSNTKWAVVAGVALAAIGVAAYLQKDRKP